MRFPPGVKDTETIRDLEARVAAAKAAAGGAKAAAADAKRTAAAATAAAASVRKLRAKSDTASRQATMHATEGAYRA